MNTLFHCLNINSANMSRLFGALVSALGLMVLIGWYLHNTTLIQVYPTLVAMQYNTALGFLLSGIGLLLSQWQQPKIAAFFGLIVLLIGGLTLVEYLAHVDLGIDQLLMEDYVNIKTSAPGRMAPNTALCFFLSGMMLTLANISPRWNKISLFGAVITGLGLIPFLGYLMEIETAYGWGKLTLMAVHTSVGFIILGVGISLWGRNFTLNSIDENHMQNLLSVGITLIVVVLAFWQALSNWEEKSLQQLVQQQLESFHEAVQYSLSSHLNGLERMGERWKGNGGMSQQKWQADVQNYIHHFQDYQAIEWVDQTNIIRWVVPLIGNEAVLNYNLSNTGIRLEALNKARQHNKVIITPPVELVQGGYGVLIYVPLQLDEEFDGFILGVVSIPKLLKEILKKSDYSEHYQINLYSGTSLMANNFSAIDGLSSQYQTSSNFLFQDMAWRTQLTPTQSHMLQLKSTMPMWMLFIGLSLTMLILLLLVLRQREQVKSRELSQEINLRKRIEYELEEKELRLRVTLENMFDAVILINAKGHILNFNKAAEQTFGYKATDVLDKNINMLMPEPYHAEHDGYLHNYLSSGKAKIIGKSREVSGLRANGEVFPMTLAVSDIVVNGEHLFSGIVRDITLHKQAKAALIKANTQNQLILDSAHDGIYGLDLNGYTTFANVMACKLTGYTLEEMLGKSQHLLIHHSHADGTLYPKEQCYIYAALHDGKIHHVTDEVFWCKDGSAMEVEYTSSPMLDSDGVVIGAVVTFQDISERKKIEKKLNNYVLQLERSNKELDDFAYVASHDLKAPLRGIMQLADWIREDIQENINKQTQDYLDLMQNRIERLERLLNDLLAYSRIGRKHGDFKVINIKDTVQDIFQMLTPPPEFSLVCEIDLPNLNTLTVPLELLLRNLISNAIKHHDTKSGIITVSAKNVTQGIEFTVADDGPGIPQQHHQRVFELFQTLKPRDEIEGSGMGLSMVKKILNRYHSTIHIESDGIRGTKIHFNWPTDNTLRSYVDE